MDPLDHRVPTVVLPVFHPLRQAMGNRSVSVVDDGSLALVALMQEEQEEEVAASLASCWKVVENLEEDGAVGSFRGASVPAAV